jgi:hypothetical protein
MHFRRFAAKHNGFLAQVVNRAALTVSRRSLGKEKGAVMKFATVSKSLVMGLALLLASSAFASTSNKGNLQLSSAVTVNGTQLKPGDYKVQWEGSGPNVEVSIMQGKNILAKLPAHVVELQSPPSNDAAVVRHNESGPNTLSGIRFGGKKFSLEIGEASDNLQPGGSSK